MQALVNVAFPIFAIMAVGYWAGRKGLLNPASTSALNRYVFLFALPAAMFGFTARADISDILNWPYIGAYMLGSLATIVLALAVARFVFRLGREEVALHGGLATYGNTGYMGIPVFLTAFGAGGILPAVVTNLIGPMLLMAAMMLALEVMRRPEASLARKLRDIAVVFARNPVIVASLLGIAFALFSIPLPLPLGNFLDLLASSAGPTALIALGLSLVGETILGDMREIVWQTVLKLLIHPLMVWLCVTYVFSLDPFWALSGVLLAAMPTGSSVFVVAQQYNVGVRRASATVALSTAVSVVTLSVLFVVLGVE
ncbi:MAG TPA: AEC family transporter [Thermohalobaculum sp.]|nr:AEC family transporter [Thermohalobaculum sp.]